MRLKRFSIHRQVKSKTNIGDELRLLKICGNLAHSRGVHYKPSAIFCGKRTIYCVVQTFFITGTDTSVGKTLLATLLIQFLKKRGTKVGGLKPISSGDREDAKKIHAAVGPAMTLDEINPWHFSAPVAPLMAAAQEGRSVTLSQLASHVYAVRAPFDVMVIEGAGGLMSPLGDRFNCRDVISRLRAVPVIVAQNRLGVVNQVLLTLEALSPGTALGSSIVLMSAKKPDASAATNGKLIADFSSHNRIFEFPWLGANFSTADALKNPVVSKTLGAILNP